MSFSLVGLGLGSPNDITIRGLNTLRNSQVILIEAYTSVFINIGADTILNFESTANLLRTSWELSPEVIIKCADRSVIEDDVKCHSEILHPLSIGHNVSVCVVGDPLCATTHIDLILRVSKSIGKDNINVIHNASIINAIGITGLEVYRYGEIVSIPFWTEEWKPDSFFQKFVENYNRNLHTLCLLDIKTREQSIENMMRGKDIYEPPRFMTVGVAFSQILECLEKYTDIEKLHFIGVARVGSTTKFKMIQWSSITDSSVEDIDGAIGNEPLHSLVICARELSEMEKEYIDSFIQEV